jgi:hypothetical protein
MEAPGIQLVKKIVDEIRTRCDGSVEPGLVVRADPNQWEIGHLTNLRVVSDVKVIIVKKRRGEGPEIKYKGDGQGQKHIGEFRSWSVFRAHLTEL